MKRGTSLILAILLAGLLAGCGSDPETEEAKKNPDQIEKIGAGASMLGYDGKAIEKQLRDVQGDAQDRNEELDEIVDN
jgi:outer membrane murein-binding lipoprotein Lpp